MGLDLDLSFGEAEAAAATSSSDEDGYDLTLDIDSAVSSADAGSTGALDLDLSFDSPGNGDSIETVRLDPDAMAALDVPGAGSQIEDDFGIDTEFQDIFASDGNDVGGTGDLDIDFDLGSDFGAEGATGAEFSLDDLPALDDDADDDDSSTLVLGRGSDGEADEVQTKLDLAQAYMDMEDVEGARGILGEVLAQGSEGQQEIARTMLSKLT
jgi:pilus assembly protein FimV